MPYVIVRHKVADYAKWRSVYDEHGATRGSAGCTGTHVFRNADVSDEVLIALVWDDLENARKFAASDDLREAMQRAGVVDQPDIYFLDDAGRTTQ